MTSGAPQSGTFLSNAAGHRTENNQGAMLLRFKPAGQVREQRNDADGVGVQFLECGLDILLTGLLIPQHSMGNEGHVKPPRARPRRRRSRRHAVQSRSRPAAHAGLTERREPLSRPRSPADDPCRARPDKAHVPRGPGDAPSLFAMTEVAPMIKMLVMIRFSRTRLPCFAQARPSRQDWVDMNLPCACPRARTSSNSCHRG